MHVIIVPDSVCLGPRKVAKTIKKSWKYPDIIISIIIIIIVIIIVINVIVTIIIISSSY